MHTDPDDAIAGPEELAHVLPAGVLGAQDLVALTAEAFEGGQVGVSDEGHLGAEYSKLSPLLM